MKNLLIFTCAIFSAWMITVPAGAAPVTIGTAQYGSATCKLIYESDSPSGPITWLDYQTDYKTWQEQVDWASGLGSGLTVTLYSGYTTTIDWTTGWRLPITVEAEEVGPSYDGSTTMGYNNTSGEMGYLFYESLGNKGMYDTSGDLQSGYGLMSTGDFETLDGYFYWSGTWRTYTGNFAWGFDFGTGFQRSGLYTGAARTLAVRPGEVMFNAVPEPSTMLLLGFGLIGLTGLRRKS